MVTRALDLEGPLGHGKSLFLFGPRGVGKSRLLGQLGQRLAHSHLIDLLKSEVYTHYLTAPYFLRQDIERRLRQVPEDQVLTVMIDEVQKLPALLDEVHSLYETHKPRLQFILTGSSARKLKHGNANLLAGRALTLHLHPLVHTEVDLDLLRALQYGTLPAIYLDDPTPDLTLKSYVQTYLKEEVFQEALVRRMDGFTRFLDLAGQYHGEPVNFTRLARAAGVSPNTVQQYYQILQDTLVAFRLDGWTQSVRKQLLASPRFYLFDCGVLNALRGEVRSELRPSTFRFGRLFETFLILECLRLNDYCQADLRFAYWRTNTGIEVDLVIQRGLSGPPLAVEIKSDRQPGPSDVTGLRSFQADHPESRRVCVCLTALAYEQEGVEFWPWRDFLQALFFENVLLEE